MHGEWGIRYLWWWTTWPVRLDIVVLGLSIAYTLATVIHVLERCKIARFHEQGPVRRRALAADLGIEITNVKSVAHTAPYLGLMGTCMGILTAFRGFDMARQAALRMEASIVAAALVPAAVGIVAAVVATCSYNCLCSRLDLLDSEVPVQRAMPVRPARQYTEYSAYGVIAAPALAILFATYLTLYLAFASLHTPRGLDIGIVPVRCDMDEPDRLIVLHIREGGRVFLNGEEEHWSTLQSRLSEIYARRARHILYLLADDQVPFQTVADAIATVENSRDVVTSRSLNIAVKLNTPTAMNARCPESAVSDSTLHLSR